jgi:hypothetical protein
MFIYLLVPSGLEQRLIFKMCQVYTCHPFTLRKLFKSGFFEFLSIILKATPTKPKKKINETLVRFDLKKKSSKINTFETHA